MIGRYTQIIIVFNQKPLMLKRLRISHSQQQPILLSQKLESAQNSTFTHQIFYKFDNHEIFLGVCGCWFEQGNSSFLKKGRTYFVLSFVLSFFLSFFLWWRIARERERERERDTLSEAAVSSRTVVTFVTWLISRTSFLKLCSRNQPCHERDHSSWWDRSPR